jgi:hypothetical protein
MRGATECARRLKALSSSLRTRLGKVSPPAGGDPVTQMILGILSRDAPESKAREALDRIRGMVVDYNELRVIPPIELADMLGDYPDVRLKCEDISRSLNRVFALNHAVNLAHLADLSAKEVRTFLDRVDGLEPYTRARVRLLGLQQHAVPLDEAMWAYARHEGIIDRRCALEDAQSFLERQIAPEDALELVALLRRQAWSDMGAAVRRGEVERIRSVPPDRTTRNMLQLVGLDLDEAALDAAALELGSLPEMAVPVDKPPAAHQPTVGRNPKSAVADAGSNRGGSAKRPVSSKPEAKTAKPPKSAPAKSARKAKRTDRALTGKGKAATRSA